MSVTLFTIGHSTHAIGVFVALLKQHGITAIADVRSAPYSRFNPQFNREVLRHSLNGEGIEYVFLGKELGARSDDPACYERGRVQYSRLARTPAFLRGLDRVLQGAARHRIALMCAEKDPLDCHRTVLVARSLVERGTAVQHILSDGSLEPYERSMDRLLTLIGLPQEDFFRSREQLTAEALTRQEERIAYTDDRMAPGTLEDSE